MRHASIASRNSLPEKKFSNDLALIRAALTAFYERVSVASEFC